MSWRYRAMKRTCRGETVFDVRAVYDCSFPGVNAWTPNAITASSDSKDGLIEVLRMMLDDVRQFDVLDLTEEGDE